MNVVSRRAELKPIMTRFMFVVPRVLAPCPLGTLVSIPAALTGGVRYEPHDLLVRRTLVRWATEQPLVELPDRRLIQACYVVMFVFFVCFF